MPTDEFTDQTDLFVSLDTGVAKMFTMQPKTATEFGETTVGAIFYQPVPCEYLLHTDEEAAVRLVGVEEVRMSVTLGNLNNVSKFIN